MEQVKKTKQINHLQNFSFLVGMMLSIISTIIIICSAYIFIQFIAKPNSPPTLFGVTPQIIMTNDMSGNKVGHVESGDLIFIKQVPIETIEMHNVVAFIDNGNVMVSRVTGIKKNGSIVLSVQSDNYEEEYLINESQVLGTIKQKVAFVGGFIYFTQSLIGIIIFIGVPSLILVALLVSNIVVKKRNKIKTKTDLDIKQEDQGSSPEQSKHEATMETDVNNSKSEMPMKKSKAEMPMKKPKAEMTMKKPKAAPPPKRPENKDFLMAPQNADEVEKETK